MEPPYLLLILASIGFNFLIGYVLGVLSISAGSNTRRRAVLIAGVAANLALLGYFKYANFFVDSVNAAFDTGLHLHTIFLPLAISFFTFQTGSRPTARSAPARHEPSSHGAASGRPSSPAHRTPKSGSTRPIPRSPRPRATRRSP